MKEFDNFQSWIVEEEKAIKHLKKVPNYTDFISQLEEKTEIQRWTYKLAMSFYLKYYYLGADYLCERIKALINYPRKDNLIHLIEVCSFFNDSLIDKFQDRYFPQIRRSETCEIIKMNMPVCWETIYSYIKGEHNDVNTFIDAVSSMLIIDFNECNQYTYRNGGDIFSFFSGSIFGELFHQIGIHPNPSISKTLPEIRKYLKYYFKRFIEETIEEDDIFFEVIDKALERYQKAHTVTWKHVLFQNGYFLIFHPDHPKGEGKYKPFRMDCAKSVKAFNHVKEYILRKLPPIEVEYEDDIIVSVKPSCFDSIDNAITTLSKHTSAPVIKIEGQKESQFAHLRKGDYTNREAKEALRQLKSQYLDYLSSIHIDTDKLYYCIEKRINSNAVVIEEDAFFFSIQSNPIYTLLAFENTLPSRATFLFTCKNNELNKAIDFIHNYFSSPEINKREKFLVKKLNLTGYGIVKYERVLHDSYSSWLTHVEGIRKNFQF